MEKNLENDNAKNLKEDEKIDITESLEQLKNEVNDLKEQLIESKTLLEQAETKIENLYLKNNEFEMYLQQSYKYKFKKFRTMRYNKKISIAVRGWRQLEQTDRDVFVSSFFETFYPVWHCAFYVGASWKC